MSEKTEQPTPKRIRESREKGDICKGQDVAPAATIFGFTIYAVANAQTIYEKLVLLVNAPFDVFHLPFDEALARAFTIVLELCISIVSCIDCFFTFLILCFKFSSFFYCFFDVCI